MGCWECYCAICGGPLVQASIRGRGSDVDSDNNSSRASSPAFPETGSSIETDGGSDLESIPNISEDERDEDSDVESDIELNVDDPDAQRSSKVESEDDNLHTDDDLEKDDSSDGSQDGDAGSSDEEGNEGYDPEVLRLEDISWTETCHVLGFNDEVSGVSKAFVSGPGTYDSYGCVDCEPGTDPNAQDLDIGSMNCYSPYEGNPVFPFHWECYELLARALTKSPNTKLIDKDVLYTVMRSRTVQYGTTLKLCYDLPGTAKDIELTFGQDWESNPGQEFFVCSPSPTPKLSRHVRSDLRRTFTMPMVDYARSKNAGSDPFARLPQDITDHIISLLDHNALMSLLIASWSLHSTIHCDMNFWKRRIEKEMPWFFELNELLRSKKLTSIKSFKGVYLWAQQATLPRKGLVGPYMAIANRRRIWSVCEQIADPYLLKLHKTSLPETIHNQASCSYMPVVSTPIVDQYDIDCVYWIHSLDEENMEKTVETFWDDEGYLVGMSVAPKGKRRLFGVDDSQPGIQIQSFDLDSGARITEIVLHIPQVNVLMDQRGQCSQEDQDGPRGLTTSPRGITICISNHRTIHLGSHDPAYCQRPFSTVQGRVIVGLMGHTSIIEKKPRILRFGLILAPWPPSDDPSTQLQVSQPPMLQKLLWKGESCRQMGRPIWNWDELTLRTIDEDSMQQSGGSIPYDIIPSEVLMWAHSTDQLEALRAITAYFIKADTFSTSHISKNGSSSWHEEVTDGICNMRIEFDPALNQEAALARLTDVNGAPFPENDLRTFEIDGPGGERIVEVAVADPYDCLGPQAFRFRTNFDRKAVWKCRKKVSNWRSITVPEGEVIVGLVLSFGLSCGYEAESNDKKHTRLSFIAALTMRCASV